VVIRSDALAPTFIRTVDIDRCFESIAQPPRWAFCFLESEMPLTIDQKIAQLQAIRNERGGDLLVLGIQEAPSSEYRIGADGQEELYAIREHAE
jgi:hypothetical protein